MSDENKSKFFCHNASNMIKNTLMITSDSSDEELIADFKQGGDRACLEAVIKRHVGKVRAMIYHMVLNDADADDLTQDVFIRMVNAICGFREASSFSTWLYRIAMNTTVGFLRKKQRMPVATESDLTVLVDGAALPHDKVSADETDGLIAKALASLSPRLRAAISLTAIQGLEAAEAARIEGCALATMYWRIHHARRLLRKKLEGLQK